MTEFKQDCHHFKSSKASSEARMNLEDINNYSEMTKNMLEGLNETEFSMEDFLSYHFQIADYATSSSFSDHPYVSFLNYQNELSVITRSTLMVDSAQETMKRKAQQVSEGSLETACAASGNGSSKARELKNLQRGRKRRNRENAQEKPAEIVHVRAKRGQATDSHSLAERVRREKINNKLKCLQNLIPGCHKTMGMAMVLDETINYVHSLQNQVQFLSTELAASCSSLGLNFGTGAIRKALGQDHMKNRK